ncbi:aminomethyl transferase family protein [Saccharopolyspora sp. K220]|uniref:aminomethyl transferase family protein n=1 Tax=Saccharopolyspora soli TaxID=2926618 RepID=UPI001F589695|nr:aminomethyl transferase family protein [Saccharopolyspora soli]MCI2419266.1 aminomethyl transferase family protein [Saccharopolyspora soli]
MPEESLEAKIRRIGDPVTMLRNAPAGAYPFPMRPEFSNWRDEQAAWKQTAALFDQSFHMTDYTFEGPDVVRLLSDTGVNSFRTFGANKAKQFVACNADGKLVGDVILLGLEDDKASLLGSAIVAQWVAFHAEKCGYDVQLTRDERTGVNKGSRLQYRYQLQGPEALAIVEKAHGGRVERLKFFAMGEFTIAERPVRVLNHTMTGIPGEEMTGLELFGPAADGPAVWEALRTAGEEFGMREAGAIAYSTTALESGWLGLPVPAIYSGESTKDFREWVGGHTFPGVASLGGSLVLPEIDDYYVTPYDLNYDRIVKFDHDFIGRDALNAAADNGPRRRKVWLRWNDEDVKRIFADSLFTGQRQPKFLQVPYAVYSTYQYDTILKGDRIVGFSNRTGYTVNAGCWFSLCVVEEAEAVDGNELTVMWGEPDGGSAKPNVERHVQTEVRATVHTQPLV